MLSCNREVFPSMFGILLQTFSRVYPNLKTIEICQYVELKIFPVYLIFNKELELVSNWRKRSLYEHLENRNICQNHEIFVRILNFYFKRLLDAYEFLYMFQYNPGTSKSYVISISFISLYYHSILSNETFVGAEKYLIFWFIEIVLENKSRHSRNSRGSGWLPFNRIYWMIIHCRIFPLLRKIEVLDYQEFI